MFSPQSGGVLFELKITQRRLSRFAWNLVERCGITQGRTHLILGQIQVRGRIQDLVVWYNLMIFHWFPMESCVHLDQKNQAYISGVMCFTEFKQMSSPFVSSLNYIVWNQPKHVSAGMSNFDIPVLNLKLLEFPLKWTCRIPCMCPVSSVSIGLSNMSARTPKVAELSVQGGEIKVSLYYRVLKGLKG